MLYKQAVAPVFGALGLVAVTLLILRVHQLQLKLAYDPDLQVYPSKKPILLKHPGSTSTGPFLHWEVMLAAPGQAPVLLESVEQKLEATGFAETLEPFSRTKTVEPQIFVARDYVRSLPWGLFEERLTAWSQSEESPRRDREYTLKLVFHYFCGGKHKSRSVDIGPFRVDHLETRTHTFHEPRPGAALPYLSDPLLYWGQFVLLIDSVEKRLPYVSGRELRDQILPRYYLGGPSMQDRHTYIEKAVAQAILVRYSVEDKARSSYLITAVRLNRENEIVKQILEEGKRKGAPAPYK